MALHAVTARTHACSVINSTRVAPVMRSGRPIGRRYAGPRTQWRIVMAAVPEGGEDIPDSLKADLARYKKTGGAGSNGSSPNTPNVSYGGSGASSSSSGGSSSSSNAAPAPIKEAIDKFLIADFFLVMAILAWLVLGLVAKSATGNSALLDAWFPLWPLVFQPIIGVLMLGALVSGGVSWLQGQQQGRGS